MHACIGARPGYGHQDLWNTMIKREEGPDLYHLYHLYFDAFVIQVVET